MKGSLDTRPIIRSKLTKGFGDVVDIEFGDHQVGIPFDPIHESRFCGATVIENNFDQPLWATRRFNALANDLRQDAEKILKALRVSRHGRLRETKLGSNAQSGYPSFKCIYVGKVCEGSFQGNLSLQIKILCAWRLRADTDWVHVIR